MFCGCDARRSADSRIIRPGPLLPRRESTNLRAVELRCGSTDPGSAGQPRTEGLAYAARRGLRERPAARATTFMRVPGPHAIERALHPRAAARAPGSSRGHVFSWAYSSIGQSSRLITGLFLVRTQVGPRPFVLDSSPIHPPGPPKIRGLVPGLASCCHNRSGHDRSGRRGRIGTAELT